jgi:hypothetical protein
MTEDYIGLLDLIDTLDKAKEMTQKMVRQYPQNLRPAHTIGDNKCYCPVFQESFNIGEGAVTNGFVNCIFCKCETPTINKAPVVETAEASNLDHITDSKS